MIKVSVLYPAKAGGRFDEEYYFNEHIPMVIRLLAPQLQCVSVETGISGAMPNQPLLQSQARGGFAPPCFTVRNSRLLQLYYSCVLVPGAEVNLREAQQSLPDYGPHQK